MTVLLDCHMARRMGLPGDRMARTYLKGREKVLELIGQAVLRVMQ